MGEKKKVSSRLPPPSLWSDHKHAILFYKFFKISSLKTELTKHIVWKLLTTWRKLGYGVITKQRYKVGGLSITLILSYASSTFQRPRVDLVLPLAGEETHH